MEYLTGIMPRERVVFLHQGYCDGVHRAHLERMNEADYAADATSVGSHTKYKEEWLASIVRRLPGICLKVTGNRWNIAAGSIVRQTSIGFTLDGDHCAQIVQRSKINLAIHGGAAEPGRDLVSMRTFENSACKGFILYIDNPETRMPSRPEAEIALLENNEDLVEKMVCYPTNHEVRIEMIERAFARCAPTYGYDARATVICNRIDAGRIGAERAG